MSLGSQTVDIQSGLHKAEMLNLENSYVTKEKGDVVVQLATKPRGRIRAILGSG